MRNKSDKSSVAFHLSEISRGPVVWGVCGDIPSRVKDESLHLAFPTTRKKKHHAYWASLKLEAMYSSFGHVTPAYFGMT